MLSNLARRLSGLPSLFYALLALALALPVLAVLGSWLQWSGQSANILLEMARTGNQRWYGKIDFQGNVARGTLDLTDADNIHLKACNGAVCQTVELIRVE